ncbi:MAG: biotin/lipoyl-binding protein, partial [Cyanobacteriota bacterium]|nr:biotin/lipoyl-binding protein [Cyanobacteriota bacterium]
MAEPTDPQTNLKTQANDSPANLKKIVSDSKPSAITVSTPTTSKSRKAPVILRIFPLLILTGAFGYWSYHARIPVNVTGSSIILTPRSRVELPVRSSGRLVALNVQSGDYIQRGQVIGLIESEELQEKLRTTRQELAEYMAENVAVSNVENQRTQLQKETFQRQREAIPIQIEANQEQIQSNEKERVAITNQRQTYQQRISQIDEINTLISERFDSYKKLVEEGAVARLDPTLIQSEDTLQKNLNEKTSLLAKLQDLYAKDQQLVASNESLLAQNQNLQAQLANLATEEEQVTLNDLESDIQRQNTIDNLRREIENLEVQLQTQSQVVSAYSGEILEISTNVGEFVSAGTSIAKVEIDTGEAKKIGLAFFTPENANRIRPGMDVEVIPNSLTERRFGGTRERFGAIVGTVTTVSKETVTPEEVASMVG